VWSDEWGWGAPRYYSTIRMADVDGDGTDDACARAAAGWRCHLSSGASFGDAVAFDELTNAGGWDAPRYYTTILSAGRACRPEMEVCNGRDDDCDGEIDEDAAAELCNGRDDDCDGMIDEHATGETCNGLDDDCDGSVDESLTCSPPDGGVEPRQDGGVEPGVDAGDGSGALSAGCGCRAAGGDAGAPAIGLGLLALVATLRRRRIRG
jgi:MYXO-CTERM domain-containing protein